jgi:hypothetical protein
VHEQWNISIFAKGQPISIESFYAGTVEAQRVKPSPFEFKVDEIVHYETWTGYIEPNIDHRRRLYIPADKSHPAWDCIYDDGATTAFFSFSISPYWSGHYQAVENSFQSKNSTLMKMINLTLNSGEPSQNSQILCKLRGMNGFELKLIESGLETKDPSGHKLEGIRFFYGCGLAEQYVRDKAGVARRMPSYKFIEFFAKEQMEKFGVKF